MLRLPIYRFIGCLKLTFAMSAQLLPASRMVFNRCSSAGVHGVFVLLFFNGGSEVKSGSLSPAGGGTAELEVPDIGADRDIAPGVRLFSDSAGEVVCGLTEV